MAQQKRDYVLKAMLEKKILLAVSGLSSAEVDGLTINFTFTDGTTDSMTFEQPADGEDGVSITDVDIDESGHLIVTLSDESTIDAGALPSGGAEIDDSTTDLDKTWSSSKISDALSELTTTIEGYVDEAIGGALNGSY